MSLSRHRLGSPSRAPRQGQCRPATLTLTPLCTLLAVTLFAAPRAEAGCSLLFPTNGQAVTCTGASTSPVAAAPGSSAVTISVDTSAILDMTATAATPITVASGSAVNNGGTVTTSGLSYGIIAAGNHDQIANQPGATIEIVNDRNVRGLGGAVLLAGSANNVVNSGSITASSGPGIGAGVEIISGGGNTGGGNTVTNNGSIVSIGASGYAIYISSPPLGGANTVVNGPHGLLQSGSGIAVVGLVGGIDLVNYGQIHGSVDLAPGANTATLLGGSSITGDLLVGGDPRATLVLAGSVNQTLSGSVTGEVLATNLVKDGSSVWTLDKPIASNTAVTISAGGLVLNTALPQSAVAVLANGQLSGVGSMASLYNQGSVAPGSAVTPLGSLTVRGNYSGSGQVHFNTVLQGTGGQASQLIIGGSTSGAQSQVVVNNLGGNGGLTVGNGIRLIEVDGTSDSQAFHMKPLQVGAYVYSLDEGGLNADAHNGSWYLRSVAGVVRESANGSLFIDRSVTPEGAAYLATQDFARTAFALSLYDRLGNQQPASGEDSGEGRQSGPWIRLSATNVSWGGPAAASGTNASSFGAQFGSDVWSHELDKGAEIRVGVMASYGQFSGHGTTPYDNQPAQVSANGLAGGFYATWFQDSRLDRGWYVDSWTLLGGINNRVTTVSGRVSDSQGQSQTSVEVGYTVPVAAAELLVTPQMQVIANDLLRRKLDDSTGAPLSEGGASWSTRLGLRVAGSATAERPYAPFVGVNLFHDGNAATIAQAGTSYSSSLPRQRYEVQGGIEWRLSDKAALSTSIEIDRSGHGYQSTAAQLAFKVGL